ncbi:hypothetical protein RB594_003037 [Gaeumannomyces avenae]
MMRRSRSRLADAVAAAAVFATWMAAPAAAHPYPLDDLKDAAGNGFVRPRDCVPCGMDNQYCCRGGEQCYTSNNIAGCTANAGGGYAIFTTTWTQTQTFTSTGSTFFPAATTKGPGNCIPPPGSGWESCGSICCAANQKCDRDKMVCLPKDGSWGGGGGGGGGAGGAWTTYTSGGQVVTTQYSAPYRVTSGVPTGTGTQIPATGTPAEQEGAAGTGGGLSAGAIAGIVIGAIVGLILLILLCACCIMRGLWHGVMALLGFGKKDSSTREKVTVEEERYVHRSSSRRPSSVHSRRDTHSSWFGGRPSAAGARKEKKSSGTGWLGLAGAAGTILLLLGLRRENKAKKQQQKRPRSEVSNSYFTDSYTSGSPSSARTGRTRDSRRTRRTETTRVSQSRHSVGPSRRPSVAPSRRHSRAPSRDPSHGTRRS